MSKEVKELFKRGQESLIKKKKKIKIGTIKIYKCKITGKKVKMCYTGEYEANNGHKGWLCLHNGR